MASFENLRITLCIGTDMTLDRLMEVPKMAALMLRDFEFQRVDKGREWVYQNHFTSVPHGWDCYVKKRGSRTE